MVIYKVKRKRLTQTFPWLLPVRKIQRKAAFYLGMQLDNRNYSKTLLSIVLPHTLFETNTPLYNYKTGVDMTYQKNKVFNLKLAAKTLNGMIIKPNETFSFWQAVRHADREIPYKNGLTITDGKLTTTYGGGICQMSNLLFWMFLHSPLVIVERHTHKVKKFPDPSIDTPKGVDATVSEGWLDLKLLNNTRYTFQISIEFDKDKIYGSLLTDKSIDKRYEIRTENLSYIKERNKVYEKVSIYRDEIHVDSSEYIARDHLYDNYCEIGYELSPDILINYDETS
nr:glycopeptide resistance accessory protein VanW [Gottschalkia acidurici]